MGLTPYDFRETNETPKYSPKGGNSYFEDFLTLVNALITIPGFGEEVNSLISACSFTVLSSSIIQGERLQRRIKFIRSLTRCLESEANHKTIPAALKVVVEVLEQIKTSYEQARPVSRKGWSMPTPTCGELSCSALGPCRALKRFLASPTEQIGRFSCNARDRSHLGSLLDKRLVRRQTDKSRVPHTLVVTKTTNHYDINIKAWRQKLDSLLQDLTPLRGPLLESLLGVRYTELVLMEGLKANSSTGEESATTHALMPISEATMNT
ncbi:hypothetical protein BT63DRAFT_424429 [Microthyrium microscopicum]|uniref:Uncharacterized protein n=1 Tax=Microthyrium microscopicum TaxID=703497 RepID=A0A6A6UHZ3_9PEZI|nr:hypothetical protein BT63DRAFT_424429 [Microthyrium microscopicum]